MVGRRLSALVDLWEGNSLVTDGFSSQRDSNTELCRFCISLSIVLNKHSSCVAINWTYTNTLSAQTIWWPFWRRHVFPWVKMGMILILYTVKWFRLYMDEWNNKHWGCDDFWHCSLCLTHLIWPFWSIWYAGLKKYVHRGQMAGMVCGWLRKIARACSCLWPSRSI